MYRTHRNALLTKHEQVLDQDSMLDYVEILKEREEIFRNISDVAFSLDDEEMFGKSMLQIKYMMQVSCLGQNWEANLSSTHPSRDVIFFGQISAKKSKKFVLYMTSGAFKTSTFGIT